MVKKVSTLRKRLASEIDAAHAVDMLDAAKMPLLERIAETQSLIARETLNLVQELRYYHASLEGQHHD